MYKDMKQEAYHGIRRLKHSERQKSQVEEKIVALIGEFKK
jgi:hypothetical protein